MESQILVYIYSINNEKSRAILEFFYKVSNNSSVFLVTEKTFVQGSFIYREALVINVVVTWATGKSIFVIKLVQNSAL